MKIYVKNTVNGLLPMYPSDVTEKQKLSIGEVYEAEIRRPRNVLFHRKFFALVSIGHQNTQLEMPFETYRRYLIMKAGYFKAYATDKGTYFEAESISFASMEETTFEELYSRVLDVVIKDIKADEKTIEEQLINFM